MAQDFQYQWTDNPTISGISPCNTDILNDCLMHLMYDKKSGSGFNLFDTKLSDYILQGEEAEGWALQGTYVYKDAVAGSRNGYPDFYAKCLEEYNTSEGIEWTQPVLTSNTTIVNEGTITVTVNGAYSDGSAGYKVFDGNNTSTYWSVAGVTGYLQIKFPYKLAVTGLTFYQKGGDAGTKEAGFYTSSDLSTPIGDTFTASQTSYGATVVSNIPTEGIITDTIYLDVKSSYGSYIGASEIKITAKNLLYKVNPNGHVFYDIADKQSVDDIFATTGMAWLYGVDTENERIFLPRNNWFEQATDNGSEVGQSVEAGLPNINATVASSAGLYTSASGSALVSNSKGDWNGGGANKLNSSFTIDASLSNSIYGNSDTVQPNAVKKLLYICVGNTTSTSAVTDVVEVTTTENDTLPLLHHIPSDELLEHPSWLRSAGQWNDGKVYTTAYEYLVNEYVNGQTHTDTLTTPDGTEYTVNYKTIKGKKVVDVANVGQVDAVYYAIGSAWYYVINQDDMTFRLPMSHNTECYTSDPTRLGLDVSAGLPNITGKVLSSGGINAYEENPAGSAVFGTNQGSRKVAASASSNFNLYASLGFDASRSNSIYGNSDTVTAPHTEFYLYFKIANAVQNLELLNAGEVLEAVSNIASTSVLKTENKAYVVETYVNGSSWYRVYSDGWCEQGGSWSGATGTTITLPKSFIDTSWTLTFANWAGTGYAKKSGTNKVVLHDVQNANSLGYSWQACGYIS